MVFWGGATSFAAVLAAGQRATSARPFSSSRTQQPAALLTLIVAIASLAAWSSSWREKDWRQWSRGDCLAVLNNSPWGQSWQRRTGPTDTPGEALSCSVYLRSALPIRQALARLQQISGAPTPNAPGHALADSSTADLFSVSYNNSVVLNVAYDWGLDVWQPQYIPRPVPDPPETGVLIFRDGRRVPPASVKWIRRTDGAYEFDLVFPREINGSPLIRPTDRSFAFRYGSQFGIASFTFKIDKMMYKGKLEY